MIIQRIKKNMKVTLPILLIAAGLFYTLTPTYPQITDSLTLTQTKNIILKVAKAETSNQSLLALDQPSGKISVELENAYKMYFKKLDSCKENKECYMNTYNDFMSEWGSSTLRKQTRVSFISNKFGVVGDLFNQNMAIFY